MPIMITLHEDRREVMRDRDIVYLMYLNIYGRERWEGKDGTSFIVKQFSVAICHTSILAS